MGDVWCLHRLSLHQPLPWYSRRKQQLDMIVQCLFLLPSDMWCQSIRHGLFSNLRTWLHWNSHMRCSCMMVQRNTHLHPKPLNVVCCKCNTMRFLVQTQPHLRTSRNSVSFQAMYVLAWWILACTLQAQWRKCVVLWHLPFDEPWIQLIFYLLILNSKI